MKLKLDGRRRVTIPTIFCEELGINENSIIDIELKDQEIVISKAHKFNIKNYIEDLLQDDISFETERYLRDILKRIEVK